METLIYLDNNATTRIDPRVLESMMPFLTETYSNASSTHQFGGKAFEAVKQARKEISELIGAESHEIIFTSGATEAINLAIKGIAEHSSKKGNHIITSLAEHSAVLDTCRYLEKKGYNVTYLPVGADGLIDPDWLQSEMRSDTILVSIMMANNETGVIQSIKMLSDVTHQHGAFFMTDATQAVGKLPIKVDDLGIDLLAFSGHKFYAPKGVGGLFVRSRRPNRVILDTLIHGGGHERGMRSGTLNVPGLVGLGKAARISMDQMAEEGKKIRLLRDELEMKLLEIDNTVINGERVQRLYNTSNICFKGADADAMIIGLKNIAVSNGSACTSASIEPSHVLKAMGLSDEDAFSSLRFSLGRFNNMKEVLSVVNSVKEVVTSLRAMNQVKR